MSDAECRDHLVREMAGREIVFMAATDIGAGVTEVVIRMWRCKAAEFGSFGEGEFGEAVQGRDEA